MENKMDCKHEFYVEFEPRDLDGFLKKGITQEAVCLKCMLFKRRTKKKHEDEWSNWEGDGYFLGTYEEAAQDEALKYKDIGEFAPLWWGFGFRNAMYWIYRKAFLFKKLYSESELNEIKDSDAPKCEHKYVHKSDWLGGSKWRVCSLCNHQQVRVHINPTGRNELAQTPIHTEWLNTEDAQKVKVRKVDSPNF
jgi:hypothetical protein